MASSTNYKKVEILSVFKSEFTFESIESKKSCLYLVPMAWRVR